MDDESKLENWYNNKNNSKKDILDLNKSKSIYSELNEQENNDNKNKSNETQDYELEKEELKKETETKNKDNSDNKNQIKSNQSKSNQTESNQLDTQIYVVRTNSNREEQVIDFIASNAKKKKLRVYSVFIPAGITGYVFLETDDLGDAELAIRAIPYTRGLLPRPLTKDEIDPLIRSKTIEEIDVNKGDIVEIIAGPLKKSKAKIVKVDKIKGNVVVEFLDSPVPIPTTLPIDHIKIIEKSKK